MSVYSGFEPEPRTKVRMKIRIWGLDSKGQPFSEHVWTTHIGPERARLEGVAAMLKPGEVIGVANGEKKSRFRVLSMGNAGQPDQGLVEMEMVAGAVDDFWGVELQRPAPATLRSERRSSPRYRCAGFVSMQQLGQNYKVRAPVSDIALNGCYVELAMPFPKGTKFHISVTIGSVLVQCNAATVSSHPGVGMGVRFESTGMVGKQDLERLLQRLERDVGPRFIR